MNAFLKDLRHGTRSLLRSPGFSLVAVLTLALGIAGTTVVFSMVNAVLLRPYPYPNADRVVAVVATHQNRPAVRDNLSYPDFLDIQSRVPGLKAVAVWDWQPYNVRGSGQSSSFVGGGQVTADFFNVLGLKPLLGRTFRPEEDRPGGPPVVILSEGLWREQFGADPDILGRTLVVDAVPRTIIGVMPRGVALPERARLWVPIALTPERSPRGQHWLGGIARLDDGVSLDQVQTQLATLGERLEQEHPETNRDRSLAVVPLREVRTSSGTRQLLLLLLGAVGFVLVIACANIASLLLARGTARSRELAVRAALGAGRARLVRQLVTESAVLGLAGCIAGYVLGRWGLDAIVSLIPVQLPAWIQFGTDPRIVAFTIGVSLASVILFGLPPALQATRGDLETALREGGLRATGARRQQRVRAGVVIGEVALSLMLLVGAALMIRSFLRLTAVEPGFETANRIMATTALAPTTYSDQEARRQFVHGVTDRVSALPGVTDMAVISRFPLRGSSNRIGVSAEGQTHEEYENNAPALTNAVTPGYFRTMGIPILGGRDFEAADNADAPSVAIINDEMARRLWPDESAIGKRIRFGPPEGMDGMGGWMEVVGVVGSVRHYGLEDRPGPQLYLPYDQSPTLRLSLVVHAASHPTSLFGAVQRSVQAVDPNQALYDAMTLDEVVSESVWQPRFFSILFWIFAGIAAVLATVGLYGLISGVVAQRRREIGVRIALGANREDVLGLVVRQGLVLVGSGLVLGLLLGVGIGQVMARALFEVSPTDPLTLIGVSVLLGTVGMAASFLPARRATRVDPMTALRSE